MAIRIKAGIEKVPGGMMLVPLLLGAVIHTLAPGAGTFFGSFTGAMFTGLAPILGVFYICLGATLDLKATPYIAKKGGALLGARSLSRFSLGSSWAGSWGGAGGQRVLAGLSVLAVVAALNDTNGGMYMSLMGQFGRNRDVGAYSVMSLESGPFLTMVTLGIAGCPRSRGRRWSVRSCRCCWACCWATWTRRCASSWPRWCRRWCRSWA